MGTAERLAVLVVDDDARVREGLRTLIGSAADLFVAGEAATPTRTLTLDRQLGPDVVLLDLLLPRMSVGLQVLEALVGRGRPVVAISIASGLRDAVLAAGAFAFLEKGGPEVDRLADIIRLAAAHRPGPLYG
jgi:DNA-binding NarL/FixJ family response regulator